MNILATVSSVIRSHTQLRDNERIIIAVSGGADSMALLHILAEIAPPQQLIAVSVDHGLRPTETPQEHEIIARSCRLLDIIFKVQTVDVPKIIAEQKRSPEDAARMLRYDALEKARQHYQARYIAVGHTADDQVEEFFIRLLRGSGSRGLSGMRVMRDSIIRPLLFATKAQLMAFLVERGLPWCVDSSNGNRQFLRNRVRLDLLPLLEKDFNPAIRTTIGHNMDILAQEDNLLEELTANAYNHCVKRSEITLQGERRPQLMVKRSEFAGLHPAIQRRILEKSCWQMGVRPTYTSIRTLVEFIAGAQNGGELHLGDGVRVEKTAHGLLFTRPLPGNVRRGCKEPAALINQAIVGPGIYPIAGTHQQLVVTELVAVAAPLQPGELRVDAAGLSFPLLLRSVQPGEKFHPYGAPGKKKISRYFNDQKIPAKERAAWPVLLSGDQVIALVGLQIDHNVRLTGCTSKILSICWQELKD